MHEEKKVKGRSIKGYCAYVKKKWGKEGLEACEKAAGFTVAGLQDEKWYPIDHVDNLITWLIANHGRDEVRLAAKSMVSEVGIVSFAARVAGMDRVLDQARKEVADSLNFGSVEIRKDQGGATVVFHDISINENNCIAWQGILEGVLALTKTKGTVKEIECQNKGAKSCVYRMTWSK